MTGLYIHIPFCVSKCGYCDFVSYTDKSELTHEYVSAVVREAETYRGETADSVFIGGGTPSCLNDGEISRLLEGVSKSIAISEDCEISIEVNPNSVTAQKAREYVNAGVNRVSIGLQAAQERLLKKIGRTHCKGDFLRAVDVLWAAGIENLNADMIYSLPTQTAAEAVETSELLCSLPIRHVSAYALKLERGVPMYGEEQPDEDADREMFYAVKDTLLLAGYERYEISNFAMPGFRCRHNLKYWKLQDYIGLGVAAHSCYGGTRFANTDSLERYIRQILRGKSAEVSRMPMDPEFEKLMLMTRLTEGMELSLLKMNEKLLAELDLMERSGLVTRENEVLRLTDRGLDIQNTIVVELSRRM